MKFRLTSAKDWKLDSEIVINTIDELIKFIDNIQDNDWVTKRIVICEDYSYGRTQDDYKYEIIIYNTYLE